jgi:hypothetical protein
MRWGTMDWIDLAQENNQWRALVNTEIYFGFRKTSENSWVAKRLVVSQGIGSMELVESLLVYVFVLGCKIYN